MNISYAILVCNESKELYSLISFLIKVKDTNDEINILYDSLHGNDNVKSVLNYFKDSIIVNERDFCGDFAAHRNYHLSKCSGDYIFVVDVDEMPKEKLIKNIKQTIEKTNADLIMIPRINIHPGATQEWLNKCDYKVNEVDWINWPDYQGRIFKNDPSTIHYDKKLHEMISGATNIIALHDNPSLALWHIKTVDKQLSRWGIEKYLPPNNENFYETLN